MLTEWLLYRLQGASSMMQGLSEREAFWLLVFFGIMLLAIGIPKRRDD